MTLAAKTPTGLHDLYAPKGARKVGLPDDGRALTPDQIVGLQVANPDLIHYPVFELNDRLLSVFTRPRATNYRPLQGQSDSLE